MRVRIRDRERALDELRERACSGSQRGAGTDADAGHARGKPSVWAGRRVTLIVQRPAGGKGRAQRTTCLSKSDFEIRFSTTVKSLSVKLDFTAR